MSTPSSSPAGPSASPAPALNKTSMVVGGLGLVAIGALAAVLLLGDRTPVAGSPPAAQAPAVVEQAAPAPTAPALPGDSAATATAAATNPVAAPAAATGKSPAPTAAGKAAAPQAPSAQAAPEVRTEAAAPSPAPIREAAPAPAPAPKAVCATCGVVTSVAPVEKKGEAGALGTVAGGVLGGVLGHQVGGGTGKTVMTVVGAVGGAMAGREVEKRQRSTTVYDLRIRMDDGSTRSVMSDTALAVGQKVRVEGDQLTLDEPAAK